jgi:hypothetical protein
MPNRNIYLATGDVPYWEEAVKIAERRGTSMSKLLGSLLRTFVHDNRSSIEKGMGLPVGFQIPKAYRDPALLAREALAAEMHDAALEAVARFEKALREADAEEKPAEVTS